MPKCLFYYTNSYILVAETDYLLKEKHGKNFNY